MDADAGTAAVSGCSLMKSAAADAYDTSSDFGQAGDPYVSSDFQQFAHFWNPYVMACWMLQYITVFSVSRYAQYRVRHGSIHWARWTLLPVYENVILIKKSAILLFFIIFMVKAAKPPCSTAEIFEITPPCDATRLGLYELSVYVAGAILCWTYCAVFVYVCARSGTCCTLHRAPYQHRACRWLAYHADWIALHYHRNYSDIILDLGRGNVLPAICVCDNLVQMAGIYNEMLCGFSPTCLTNTCTHDGCTPLTLPVAWGPSFLTNALPTDMRENSQRVGTQIYAWMFLVGLLVMTIGSCLMLTKHWWPRDLSKALCLIVLWQFWNLLNVFDWPIQQAFGFTPTVLFSVIETPLKVYLMLLDSRYWANLRPVHANSAGVPLDAELDSPLLQQVVGGLQDVLDNSFLRETIQSSENRQVNGSSESPPCIHWASVQLETKLGYGATATVWRGMVGGKQKAVKRFNCEMLVASTIQDLCREIFISRELALYSDHVVQCDGYCVHPPFASVVMDLCEFGSLWEVLHESDEQFAYGARCELALDAASAMECLHARGLLHRCKLHPAHSSCADHLLLIL